MQHTHTSKKKKKKEINEIVQWVTELAAKSDILSSILRLTMERENWLPQVVLWLSHAYCGMSIPPIFFFNNLRKCRPAFLLIVNFCSPLLEHVEPTGILCCKIVWIHSSCTEGNTDLPLPPLFLPLTACLSIPQRKLISVEKAFSSTARPACPALPPSSSPTWWSTHGWPWLTLTNSSKANDQLSPRTSTSWGSCWNLRKT